MHPKGSSWRQCLLFPWLRGCEISLIFSAKWALVHWKHYSKIWSSIVKLSCGRFVPKHGINWMASTYLISAYNLIASIESNLCTSWPSKALHSRAPWNQFIISYTSRNTTRVCSMSEFLQKCFRVLNRLCQTEQFDNNHKCSGVFDSHYSLVYWGPERKGCTCQVFSAIQRQALQHLTASCQINPQPKIN